MENKEVIEKRIKINQEHFIKCIRAMVNDYCSSQRELLNNYNKIVGEEYDVSLS